MRNSIVLRKFSIHTIDEILVELKDNRRLGQTLCVLFETVFLEPPEIKNTEAKICFQFYVDNHQTSLVVVIYDVRIIILLFI